MKSSILVKTKKAFVPATRVANKVLRKVDKNKPEILLVGGIALVVVGTITAIIRSVNETPDLIAESREEKMKIDAEHEGLVVDISGEPVPPISDQEYNKRINKLRFNTCQKMAKLYGLPAIEFVIGLILVVDGHHVLKSRYLVTAMSLKGTQEVLDFVKKNVIADQGEEKWEEYRYGKASEDPVTLSLTDGKGNVVKQESTIARVKDHDNPWRVEFCEEFFKSWRPDSDSNLSYLQGTEKFWNDYKYKTDKDAEFSMYEILDYMGARWEKFPKEYREWLRTNGWGHDINGDDFISFGLQKPINEPTRRRMADKIFIEFNADGILIDLTNRYRNAPPKHRPIRAGEYMVREALGIPS